MTIRRLLRYGARVIDDLAPFREFGLDEFGEVLRRTRGQVDTLRHETLPHLGQLKLNKGWRAFQTISSTLSSRFGVLQVDWFLPDDLIPA